MEVAGYFQGARVTAKSPLAAQPAREQRRGEQRRDQKEDPNAHLADWTGNVLVFDQVVNQPADRRAYNEED